MTSRPGRRFHVVDVFTDRLLLGNPVAVVHDAEGLSEDELAAVARWTNLSETTFLLPPTDPAADYRLRIFTVDGELPFAGHPTLGSARAWLAAGHRPRTEGRLVQECGAGLVDLRVEGDVLAFRAPPLLRDGPVDAETRARIVRGLRIDDATVEDLRWADNGPGWIAVLLRDADAVLALEPDPAALAGLHLGVVGRYPPGGEVAVEVRAFTAVVSALEDPVTGSVNAAIGQWLTADGRLPARYTAAQGTRVQRRGRVLVERVGEDVWVGGSTVVGVTGVLAG